MANDPPYAEFAALIERLKTERRLKQSAIAQAVGVAPSQPSGWATGRSRPKPETLERLAEVYGLDLDELLRLCRYRSRVERTFDPDEAELLALFRQVPDEHRPAAKGMLRGLAVQPTRMRAIGRQDAAAKRLKATDRKLSDRRANEGDEGSSGPLTNRSRAVARFANAWHSTQTTAMGTL